MIERARAQLAAVAAADLSLCSTSELAEQMRQLRDVELTAVAERLRRLEMFDRLEGYTDDGHLTAAAWLRNELSMSNGSATAEIGVARVRRNCAELARAFDAGRTSFRHLQVTAAAMRRLAEPAIWAELDETITGWAQKEPAAVYAQMLDALVEQLKPEPKPKDEKQLDQRRLSVTNGFDGTVNVSGRLTPEVGEKLHAALSAASRPDVTGETRSAGQRKADALEQVLDTVLDTALLPVDGGEKPHITLQISLDQLGPDEPAADTGVPCRGLTYSAQTAGVRVQEAAAAAMAQAVNGQPRFSWTGPTGPGTARRLSCDGIVLPIFTRDGRPIDVGRRTRIISAPLRAFIVARDRHCRWPGCDMPARWTQVHHVRHWRDGGCTDRTNLILICQAHHRAAHDGRWTITLHGPGRITVRRRRHGDRYYEIVNPDPPPENQLPLDGMLATAARHLSGAP